MEFRDRVTSLPEEKKGLVDIGITLYDDKTIGLSIEPIGDDIKKSGDVMVKFLLEDFILTGVAMVRDIGQGPVEDGVEMVNELMKLWADRVAGWNDLSFEEKKEILSKDDEDVADG